MGFEPTDAFTSPVFKTGAFDHSAISPCVKVHSTQTQDLLYHRGLCLSTINKERKDVFSRKNGLTFVGGGGIINKLIPFRECKSEYPGVAKFGIALEWGSRGLEFESRHSDHRRQKVGSLSDNYQLFAYIESNHVFHMWLKMCSCCIPIADTIIAHLLPKFHKFCHISG